MINPLTLGVIVVCCLIPLTHSARRTTTKTLPTVSSVFPSPSCEKALRTYKPYTTCQTSRCTCENGTLHLGTYQCKLPLTTDNIVTCNLHDTCESMYNECLRSTVFSFIALVPECSGMTATFLTKTRQVQFDICVSGYQNTNGILTACNARYACTPHLNDTVYVVPPTTSLPPGTYRTNTITIPILTVSPLLTVYYTADGTTPVPGIITDTNFKYDFPFPVSSPGRIIITAIAIWNTSVSEQRRWVYILDPIPTVPAPEIRPAFGSYGGNIALYVISPTNTNLTKPNSGYSVTLTYTNPTLAVSVVQLNIGSVFWLVGDGTHSISVVATASGFLPSNAVTGSYQLTKDIRVVRTAWDFIPPTSLSYVQATLSLTLNNYLAPGDVFFATLPGFKVDT
eukprot:PhF_6_TR24824/c0_g1_i3/m.34205